MVVVYSHLVAAFREESLLLGALLRPSTFFLNDVFSSGFGGRGIAFLEENILFPRKANSIGILSLADAIESAAVGLTGLGGREVGVKAIGSIHIHIRA